jgi:hypothetical protein
MHIACKHQQDSAHTQGTQMFAKGWKGPLCATDHGHSISTGLLQASVMHYVVLYAVALQPQHLCHCYHASI